MTQKNMIQKVNFLEVGPRDGLQNESSILSLEDKTLFIQKLAQAGLNRIELGSFVSPKWIPQMQNTDKLVEQVLKEQDAGRIPKHIEFSALVPNLKGLYRALSSGIKEISIFLSATESFSDHNINCSIQDSYIKYKDICKQALKENLKIRAYLSVCFYCPYEGKVLEQKVVDLIQKIEDLSVYEISISDTTGQASPLEVQNLLQKIIHRVSKNKLAGHFHNVHGMALANVWSAYQSGICTFDSSVGGLGGCPYAKTPSGNVATEELAYIFQNSQNTSIKNISIKKLIDIGLWLEKKLDKKLHSSLLHSPYYKK